MPKKPLPLSNAEFLGRVRDYLPVDALVWSTDDAGRPRPGRAAGPLEENAFHLFDADAVLAISHAIEELALEEARGTVVAAMQDFTQFEPHRERYWQLAATLPEVRVVAAGRRPRRHGHLQFTTTGSAALQGFWCVVYEGPRAPAMLACRQVGRAGRFESRRFIGFHSVTPAVVRNARRDLLAILAGEDAVFHEFERLRAIDQSAKTLRAVMNRERRLTEAGLDALRAGENGFNADDLERGMNRSLQRLQHMADRLTATLKGDVSGPSHD